MKCGKLFSLPIGLKLYDWVHFWYLLFGGCWNLKGMWV